MKIAIALLLLVAAVSAAPSVDEKRFIVDTIKNALHKLEEAASKAYNSAKNAVEKVVHGINFDAVLAVLKPLLTSTMSESACVTVCEGAADSVIPIIAPVSAVACPPLCDAALKQLQAEVAKAGR